MHEIKMVRVESPVDGAMASRLIDLWETVFETSYDSYRPILAGAEREANRHVLLVAEDGEQIAGTCELVTPMANPAIGGLAMVATHPDYRGRGIAHLLSAAARDEFVSRGGRALFLGTYNPVAQAIYQRLGWRRVLGSEVMCFCTAHATPEEFLTEYYQYSSRITIVPGNACHRIPMIPLILSGYHDRVLDANREIYSTRYAVQRSCIGLYPGYEAIAREGGAWFAASADGGRLGGIATAVPRSASTVEVGAFCHGRFPGACAQLLDAAITWARQRQAVSVIARLATLDRDKQACFERHGFRPVGPGEPFVIEGTQWESIRLERSLM